MPSALSKIDIAAQFGDLETFKQLYKDSDERVWMYAARYEQIDILRYMKSISVVFDEHHLKASAVLGFVGCFIFLHAECGISVNVPGILSDAARSSFQIFKYAHEAGAEFDEMTTLTAASDGNLDCLRYAADHGAYVHHDTIYASVYNGNFDCIKYCLEHFHISSSRYLYQIYRAAAKCKLEIFRWIHEHSKIRALKYTVSADVMNCAMFYDNVDVLRYMYEQGVRWDGNVRLTEAFHGGKLECIAFAVQHGYKDPLMSKSVIRSMVEEYESVGGSWLEKIESCFDKKYVRTFLWAFYEEHVDVLYSTVFGQAIASCFMKCQLFAKGCGENLCFLPRDLINCVIKFI